MKKILLSFGLFLMVCAGIALYMIMKSPVHTELDTIRCEYNGVSHKIICIETGDIVPQWLDLRKDYYFRQLVIKNSNNFIVMNMTDRYLIPDLKRKFIYTLEDKNLIDFFIFKNFVYSSEISNWGSVALTCSEKTLKEKSCKFLKELYENKYSL